MCVDSALGVLRCCVKRKVAAWLMFRHKHQPELRHFLQSETPFGGHEAGVEDALLELG
jgi:hypothetical protein